MIGFLTVYSEISTINLYLARIDSCKVFIHFQIYLQYIYIKRLDEITILPSNSESYQILQQMIESSDKNLFSSLNNESLSLFNSAICHKKNNINWKLMA